MNGAMVRKSTIRSKKYICNFGGCGKGYSRPCLLEQHRRTHLNERPFKCAQCGKSFFRDSHLKVHLWTHSTDKPLKCQICSKGFVTSQQLSRHHKTHPSEFECPYECEKSFLTNEELSDHMLSDHVMNDIIDTDAHQTTTESILKDLQFQLDYPDLLNTPDLKIYQSPKSITASQETNTPSTIDGSKQQADIPGNKYWSIWDDHHCKEPNCQGFPKYKNYQDLIFHYDEYHKFVPKSLFQVFELDTGSQDSTDLKQQWPHF